MKEDKPLGNHDYFMTLDEIAVIFGVTRERIRQIEKRALVKLYKRHGRSHVVEYLSQDHQAQIGRDFS